MISALLLFWFDFILHVSTSRCQIGVEFIPCEFCILYSSRRLRTVHVLGNSSIKMIVYIAD